MAPKTFISYSWTSQSHQELVISWAERLIADGVDVVLDVYDLKEGQDKFAFMERMVTDPTVSHVLLVSDKEYARKADARKAGVGSESQIISREVYEKAAQSKFIPLACEFGDDGNPFLPTFLKSRIWIDFSSPELVNRNWEKLVRTLFGKPAYEKPALGKAPAYLAENGSESATPIRAKYEALHAAVMQSRRGLPKYRRDFLDAVTAYVDSLRTRTGPAPEELANKIVDVCSKLTVARDFVIDWIVLESEVLPSEEFLDALVAFMETLHELKSRPQEVTQWNEAWFDGHKLFVYDLFLYIVAALLKTRSYEFLHSILTTQYLLPASAGRGGDEFVRFDSFYAYSDVINAVLAPPGQKLYSPAAELVKRHAQRADIPFSDIIQADLVVLLMAFLDENVRWYPQTMHYWPYGKEFPFFVRAAQHKHFKALATIAGVADAGALRQAVKAGQGRLKVSNWHQFMFHPGFWGALNMDKLDTL